MFLVLIQKQQTRPTSHSLSNVVLNYIFVFGENSASRPWDCRSSHRLDCRGVYLRRLLRTLGTRPADLTTNATACSVSSRASPAVTATDIPCFADDRTVFHLVGFLALFFFLRASSDGRSRSEHQNWNVSAFLHTRWLSDFDRNGHRQQSDGQRQTAGGHARLLPHHADVRGGHPAAVPARHGLPGAHHAHLHRQCRPDSRRRTLHARHAAHLHPQRAGLRPLPRRIGNRQYAPGIPDGASPQRRSTSSTSASSLSGSAPTSPSAGRATPYMPLGLLVLSYLYLKRADWQSKRI